MQETPLGASCPLNDEQKDQCVCSENEHLARHFNAPSLSAPESVVLSHGGKRCCFIIPYCQQLILALHFCVLPLLFTPFLENSSDKNEVCNPNMMDFGAAASLDKVSRGFTPLSLTLDDQGWG